MAAFIGGFAWAGLHVTEVLEARSALLRTGQSQVISGIVDGLSASERGRTRFLLRPQGLGIRLQLSWYGAPRPPQAGEHWQLEVRLRPPRGARSIHGSDYEAWLLRQRVAAVGYVRRGSRVDGHPRTLAGHLDHTRQQLTRAIASAVRQPEQAALVSALAVGDRQSLTRELSDLLVRTGTMHLLAISGLHIGLVAAFGFLVVRQLWSRLPPCCERWPAQRAGAVAALISALLYACLAGLSLPTQRALAMTAAALGAMLVVRESSLTRILALALLGTTLVDPLAPLGADFWLSFAAVGAIGFMFVGRLSRPTALGAWLRVQVLLPAVMIPVSLTLFGAASVVGSLANLVAVPWVSMIAVPLTLLGTSLELVWSGGGAGSWQLAAASLGLLVDFLDILDRSVAPVAGASRLTLTQMVAALVGAALILAPRGLPAKAAGLVLWLGIVLAPPQSQDGLRIALLDSGDDSFLAVAHSQNTAMVFGTGRRRGGLDPAERLLLPYLAAEGVRELDLLVVSGVDGQQIGGVRAVLETVPVRSVRLGDPLHTPVMGGTRCDQNQPAIAADGVTLESRRDHPTRCLVSIDAPGGGKVLIAPHGWSALDRIDLHSLRAVVTSAAAAEEVLKMLGKAAIPVLLAGRFPAAAAPTAPLHWLETAAVGDIVLSIGARGDSQLDTWSKHRRRLWHAP